MLDLLSPVGDFDCLKAAVQNGADSVYFGADLFSARAFAHNFNLAQFKPHARRGAAGADVSSDAVSGEAFARRAYPVPGGALQYRRDQDHRRGGGCSAGGAVLRCGQHAYAGR